MGPDMCVPCGDGLINLRVGAIIRKNGKLLMAGNSRDSWLYSVGGRIRMGESSEEAVIREVHEETGVRLEVERLAFVHENYFYGSIPPNRGKLIYELCFYYLMRVPEDFEPVSEHFSEDGLSSCLRWVSPDTPLTIFPDFFRTELAHMGPEVRYILKDERKPNKEEKNMHDYESITLREKPELEKEAAAWFHDKWGVPEEAYLECMDAYLAGNTELGWYLCLDGGRIVGGLGVIENDFHDRKDLRPNVCAMYVEEAHRKQGIAGRLLNMAVEDLRSKGISPVYLVTDHTGFYERYGWEYFCPAQGDGEDHLTRLYIHK